MANWLKRVRAKVVGGLLALLAALFGWQYLFAASELAWIAPTENTDGSPLTDLANFRVYRAGVSGGPYALIDTVPAGTTSYTDNATLEGLNCYVVTAVDRYNNESDYSNEACKTVDTLRPNAPTGLTAQ